MPGSALAAPEPALRGPPGDDPGVPSGDEPTLPAPTASAERDGADVAGPVEGKAPDGPGGELAPGVGPGLERVVGAEVGRAVGLAVRVGTGPPDSVTVK